MSNINKLECDENVHKAANQAILVYFDYIGLLRVGRQSL